MAKRIILVFYLLLFLPPLTFAEVPPTISIANFNIQVFGTTKAGKPEVMEVLAKIIARYDIVAIQEIRNASGQAIKDLEAAVDTLGTDYEVIVGPRLGRTSSKEQYAFMYRSTTVERIGTPLTYPEPTGTDPFHREPFMARFKSGSFDFVLITIHTDPDEATEEITALDDVVMYAQLAFYTEGDFIILGDLNADCSYYNERDPNPLPDFTWLIPDTLDTTVKGTICTYDRIIVGETTIEDYAGNAGVFRFDIEYGLSWNEGEAVSDHYPVFAEFWTDRDTD